MKKHETTLYEHFISCEEDDRNARDKLDLGSTEHSFNDSPDNSVSVVRGGAMGGIKMLRALPQVVDSEENIKIYTELL